MNPFLRYAATVIVTGLTAAYSYYPAQHWIPIVLGIAANLGIHVIPAVVQGTRTVKAGEDPTQS